MTRDYRIIARIKNNRLWQAIRQQWPDVTTQSDAARRLDVTPSEIGRLLNMTHYPRSARTSTWTPIAQKIATILRDTPEYLFDESLYGVKPKTVILEIDRPALEAYGLLALPVRPDEIIDQQERETIIRHALSRLTPKEETVIRLRYGLDNEPVHTYEAIGVKMKYTRSAIQTIERKALRKLRHPSRHVSDAL